MVIKTEQISETSIKLSVSGCLDTATSPMLEKKLNQWGENIAELTLDFINLTYISSMGLRILLKTQKAMKEQNRKLVIINMSDSIREIFEITGFINLMQIE